MKIEEAIKSRGFTNEAHRTQVNILYTAAHLNLVHNRIFKKHGITNQQYNVMRIIKGQAPKPASVQLINDRMLDRASNGSRIVDKLVEKKLVLRKVCPDDRRQVDITLTEKAAALIDVVHKELMERFAPMEDIDPKTLALLNDTLDLIRTKTKHKDQ